MSAPVPVAETYIPCYELAATVGGVATKIMSGGFSLPVNVDDMTNNAGGGYYEDVPTVKKATFKMSIALSTTATGLKSGSIYPVLINCATMPTDFTIDPTPVVTGLPCFAGNVRLIFDDAPILDVQKGATISVSGNTQGKFGYAL